MTKNLIRDRRLALGLTMKELADRVGVAEATVSRWEAGDIANMRRDRIYKLAKALDVSPLLLLGYDEQEVKQSAPFEDLLIHGDQKQPPAAEELSDMAIQSAKLVDRLPDDARQLLLVQVRALAQGIPDRGADE